VQRPSLVEIARVIEEEEPAPLRPVGTERVDRDVETIVRTAMAKDPARRYATAADLAADLERLLAAQPILSRPPSRIYRLRKLVQRHPAPTALLGTLFVALVAFAVTVSAMYGAQRQALERSERESRKAERINALLQGMLTSADPHRGDRDVTVREVLHRADGMVEDLADEPEVQAEMHRSLGNTYRALGFPDEAGGHLSLARETFGEIFGPRDPRVAETLCDEAALLGSLGRHAEAESLARASLGMLDEMSKPPPGTTFRALEALSGTLREEGRYEEAERLLERAIDLARTEDDRRGPRLADALTGLAYVFYMRGEYARAEPLVREALDLRLATSDRFLIAESLNNLGGVLHQETKLAEALDCRSRALAEYEAVLGADHVEVAAVHTSLGRLLDDLARFDEAEAHYRKALAILERTYGPEHPSIAGTLRHLGLNRAFRGQYAEAESLVDRSLDLHARLLGPEHPLTGLSLWSRGYVLLATSRIVPAESSLVAAAGIYRRNDPGHPGVAPILADLAATIADREQEGRAEALYRDAFRTAREALGDEHLWTANAARQLASYLLDHGRVDEADPLLEGYADVLRDAVGEGHWQYALLQLDRARVLDARGRPEDARPLREQAESILADERRTPELERRRARDRRIPIPLSESARSSGSP